MMLRRALLSLLVVALAGCRAGRRPALRPYHLKLPAGYLPGTPAPLLLMFHGYGSSALQEEAYLRLSALSDQKGFIYASADGTVDPGGLRFWNATDACCDLYGIPVDDVAYATAILDDVQAKYAVDPKRIFVIGHSNGGFLAHRLACDLSGRIAGIVSLAGATWSDAGKCKPAGPVAVLQIHGDADPVILYGGGRYSSLAPAYPSAHQTVATWAALDGCGALQQTSETLDLDSSLAGAETGIERSPSCRGGAAELWTIHGGSHLPSFNAGWSEPVWRFLSAHPKP